MLQIHYWFFDCVVKCITVLFLNCKLFLHELYIDVTTWRSKWNACRSCWTTIVADKMYPFLRVIKDHLTNPQTPTEMSDGVRLTFRSESAQLVWRTRVLGGFFWGEGTSCLYLHAISSRPNVGVYVPVTPAPTYGLKSEHNFDEGIYTLQNETPEPP